MKVPILILFCICSYALSAQQLVFSTGSNQTTYIYKDATGEVNSNIDAGSGNFYELGYLSPIGSSDRFNFVLGMSLNEYTANGGNLNAQYNWETKYLGIKTGFSYAVLSIGQVKGHLDLQLQASTIVSGEQRINTTSYDLTKENDFKGIFLQPVLGGNLSFPLSDKVDLGVGYSYGKSAKVGNTEAASLKFENHQWRVSLHLKLNKKIDESLPVDSDTNQETGTTN